MVAHSRLLWSVGMVLLAAEARAQLRAELYDIFVSDLNLGGGTDGIPVVASARADGFAGPIAVLTAETSPAKVAAVRAAGIDHVRAKPYQRNSLVQMMVTLHQQAGPVGAGEVVYSTLSGQPETEELLAAYVADVRKTTQELQKAALAGDFAAVRDHCLSLRGSAPGYGFPSLGAAAEEAVQAPDATLSVSHARPKLRTLLLICGQLGIRKAAAPAKPDVERLV